MIIPFAKIGIAATAVALGTVGVMVLTSDEAKKVYTKVRLRRSGRRMPSMMP